MNTTPEGINGRITEAEKWVNGLEDRMVEITAAEQRHNIKCTKIHIQGSQKEKKEKVPEKVFEEMIAENFPNMGEKIVNQVQEAQRVSGRINPRRNIPRHMVIKLTKVKDKLLKQQGKHDK